MTKLLLFSDVHADVAACKRLVRMAESVDIVIGAGDFGHFRTNLEPAIDVLQAIRCPAVLVPGNGESETELRQACRNWTGAQVLHGRSAEILGISFFGLGGGIPITPFGSWSWDFSEAQARELLATCPPGSVLVSHSPPWGAVDRSGTRHLGSRAVLEAIQQRRPRLVVCGHIHASAGQQATVGETTVINAGSDGIVWDFKRQEAPRR